MNKNASFLIALPEATAIEIADSIAARYGITREEAIDEVISDEAEDLLEYLSGPIRLATSLLLKRHGF